jgi:hypothetical protein
MWRNNADVCVTDTYNKDLFSILYFFKQWIGNWFWIRYLQGIYTYWFLFTRENVVDTSLSEAEIKFAFVLFPSGTKFYE